MFKPDFSLIIGQGGLIGRTVRNELRKSFHVFDYPQGINWDSRESAKVNIEAVIQDFFRAVGDGRWIIFWCAGKGTFKSSANQMSNELDLFSEFLNKVANQKSRNGRVVFISSAGGVYGSNWNGLINGHTPVAPNSDYGISKFRQEESLKSFSAQTHIKSVICRLSTVYGSGQDMHKSQGLITHLCFSSMLRRPANIFVSLATSRNYLFNQDAGRLILEAGLQPNVCFESQEFSIHRIVAPQSHSIAEIMNTVELVYKRKIPTANRIDYRSSNYAPRFDISCSLDFPSAGNRYTSLLVGVGEVKQDLIMQLQSGRLQHLL